MYQEFSKFVIAGVFIFFVSLNVFSQQQKIMPPVAQVTIKQDSYRFNESLNPISNPAIENLQNKMLEFKKAGDISGVQNIQRELDALTGSSTILSESLPIRLVSSNPVSPDNILAGQVSNVTGVKGMASCTEQIGFSAGRIWSVFMYGPLSGDTPDRLRVCHSEDGGQSWAEYVTIDLQLPLRMINDEIDAEILEPISGNKYLYVVFTYSPSGAQKKIGMIIIQLTGGLTYGGHILNWPGTTTSTFYHRPRITSDNETFRSNPWIYIIAAMDSAVAGGYYSGQKTAVVFSPYNNFPLITYKPTPPLGLLFKASPDHYCDLAYFRNGGTDSILIVESTLQDSSKIILSKTSIGSFASSGFASYVGNISTSSSRRYQAYIASNGGYNKLMIVNMRKYSPTDWDIEYFGSSNGSAGWSNGYVDYRSNNSTRADIIGFRSAPGFYAASYSENTLSFVPAVYCEAVNGTWGSIVPVMNHINTNPFTAQPRPGIRYGPTGESCFTFWTEYSGSSNVWASRGCEGIVYGLKNIYFRGVIEAMWDAPADTLRADSVTLYLREDFPPYNIVDSSKVKLDNDGYGTFWFTNAQNYVNYYISARHRNSIETWSATTFQYNPTFVSYSYDFTFSPLQAYGVNEVQVDVLPDLFAFYSGDVNQDGAVNLNDILIIYNDANNFISGYVTSDLNNDDVTNLTDLLIAYNNAAKFVVKITP